MGTFNACTVREEARLVELAHCAEERGVEILGVQDYRRVHTDDQIVYHKVEICTFITSSAWPNEALAATDGVGLMLGSPSGLLTHRKDPYRRVLIQTSNNSHSRVLTHQRGPN